MARKPLPSAIKELRGNPGKRPINKLEPSPRRALPRCPAHLDDEARRAWRRLSRDLYDAGVLTAVDRDLLAAYCQAFSRWVNAELKVRATGEVIKTTNGNLIQNPYLGIANRAIDQMARLAGEFGLTPSSRAHLKVEPAKERSLADILFDGSVEDG